MTVVLFFPRRVKWFLGRVRASQRRQALNIQLCIFFLIEFNFPSAFIDADKKRRLKLFTKTIKIKQAIHRNWLIIY